MSKIIDFNSLWEISFAVNAIFVFFELTPVLEKKFIGVQAIGRDAIDAFMDSKDKRYINSYGWKSVIFGFVNWVSILKSFSVFNSIAAISLIIIAGFMPEAQIKWFFLWPIILLLLTPVVLVPAIIKYIFPIYKLRCIEEAVQRIIESEDGDSTFIANKLRRYKIAIEYIKLTELGPSLFIKRDKEYSNREIFKAFEDLNK